MYLMVVTAFPSIRRLDEERGEWGSISREEWTSRSSSWLAGELASPAGVSQPTVATQLVETVLRRSKDVVFFRKQHVNLNFSVRI